MVASSILQSIQQLVSRMNDPLNPLVITVGKVTAGNRWNVLAGHATLEGTVRTFLTGTQVEDALRKVAECTAAAFGAKAPEARAVSVRVLQAERQHSVSSTIIMPVIAIG